MTKQLLLLLITFSIPCFSQIDRKIISGKISHDSLSTENIHIINKTSGVATISNEFGKFRIPVKENDTLLFSSIQFANKKIIVHKKLFSRTKWIIKLEVELNQLDEVDVNNHNLLGNLSIDASNYKDSIDNNVEEAIRFDSSKLISDFDKTKTYFPEYTADPIPKKIGVDFAQIFRIAFLKLKKEKNKTKIDSKSKLNLIREKFGESFFTKNLKLKKQHIDTFISQCVKRGIYNLYINNRKLEMINLMVSESKVFLLDLKNEKK